MTQKEFVLFLDQLVQLDSRIEVKEILQKPSKSWNEAMSYQKDLKDSGRPKILQAK